MHIEVAPVKPKKKTKDQFTTLNLFWTSILYQTKEFFNNSTLHGVRYIAEEGRPFGERFMWFCFTVTGGVSALIIIVSLWEKFQTNPTITGLDTDFHNQQVIFPTIALCPYVPFDANRTRDLAFGTMAFYEEDKANRLEPVLQKLTELSFSNMLEITQLRNNLNADEARSFLTNPLRTWVFMSNVFCSDTFDTCKYKDEEIQCCEFFFPVYTEHGFCYAFNGQYTDSASIEIRRTTFNDLFETDKKWSLFFKPKLKSRIFVHSHQENFGWDYRPQIEWDLETSSELLISMKQTYTTEDARQLSVLQRKCIFPDELKLDIYSDEYTFTSCMKECRIEKCLRFCKCIPPFYKPLAKQKYCNLDQLGCLAKFVDNITDVKDCSRCELSCSNTVYDIEKLSETIGSDQVGTEKSYVNIEYLTWPIIRYKREVLFGWVDLLVSFGGIAGLFLGFSLLSGVEIIYYFTMRACCMLYKNRAELYKIKEEKLLRTQKRYYLALKLLDISGKNSKALPNVDGKDSDGVIRVVSADGKAQNGWMESNRPKRLNRANLKLQAARDLVRPRFNQVKAAPSYKMPYDYVP